ncbi:MAG: STAS domain-containing protein [Ruminococcus sp.]|nr:STAS domain-containing protein [Ruminococcus sp.]
MNITKQNEADKLVLLIDGKLDTLTAPQLDAALREAFEASDNVEVNLEKLAYVSSAGLRVLHAAHKRVKGKGRLEISHANGTVLDVFESTGFSSYLTII